MDFRYFEDYESMSQAGAAIVLEELKHKEDMLLCAPTGSSPTGVYKALSSTFKKDPAPFKNLRVIKLDEWGGLPNYHPATCEYYLIDHLLGPLAVPVSRCISFESSAENPEKECERVQAELDANGPIDLCILGLGTNGHIGFNEPASALQQHCHVARLSQESKQHGMVKDVSSKPSHGLTLGIKDILSSKKILLLVYGEGKEEAIKVLKSERISALFPVTFLWLHNNVECLMVT